MIHDTEKSLSGRHSVDFWRFFFFRANDSLNCRQPAIIFARLLRNGSTPIALIDHRTSVIGNIVRFKGTHTHTHVHLLASSLSKARVYARILRTRAHAVVDVCFSRIRCLEFWFRESTGLLSQSMRTRIAGVCACVREYVLSRLRCALFCDVQHSLANV